MAATERELLVHLPGEDQQQSEGPGALSRTVLTLAGGALAAVGVRQRTRGGAALAAAGGAVAYKGLFGHWPGAAIIGKNYEQGAIVDKSVTINVSPEEAYAFWRRLENLPRFMPHLKSVTDLGGGRSNWVAEGPGGITIEWDAETVEDRRGELIAWRSVANADIDNRGVVEFRPADGDRGTVVRAIICYKPPAGAAGKTFAKLFTDPISQMVKEDMRRFKYLMEAGEIPTITGQSSGRKADRKARERRDAK